MKMLILVCFSLILCSCSGGSLGTTQDLYYLDNKTDHEVVVSFTFSFDDGTKTSAPKVINIPPMAKLLIMNDSFVSETVHVARQPSDVFDDFKGEALNDGALVATFSGLPMSDYQYLGGENSVIHEFTLTLYDRDLIYK